MVGEWVRPEEAEENRQPEVHAGTEPGLGVVSCERIKETRDRLVTRRAHDAEEVVVVEIEAEAPDIERRRNRCNGRHDERARQSRARSPVCRSLKLPEPRDRREAKRLSRGDHGLPPEQAPARARRSNSVISVPLVELRRHV